MDEIQILIDQMASDIARLSFQLESSRLLLFLEWLVSHSSKVQNNGIIQLDDFNREQFKINLNAWFQSLPLNGLLWEYRLLVDEIDWWRNLDPAMFAMWANGHSKE
jgi:hypothetical protein